VHIFIFLLVQGFPLWYCNNLLYWDYYSCSCTRELNETWHEQQVGETKMCYYEACLIISKSMNKWTTPRTIDSRAVFQYSMRFRLWNGNQLFPDGTKL